MSKLTLRRVVDEIVQDLNERGFPLSIKAKRPIKPSGTFGSWCKIFSMEDWHLEVWFDRWRHTDTPEFYYGFFSKKKNLMEKFLPLIADGSSIFEIKDNQEEYFEGDEVRLKQPVAHALGYGMMIHRRRGRYWFGKYSIERQIFRDATGFFSVILQEVNPPSFREGSCAQVTVDHRERNPEARRLCLQKYGFRCVVCSFDFEETYGVEIGSEFIHVHHTKPIADDVRETNPWEDLVPVCPNCHAMLHRRNPPLEADELRRALKRQSK